MSETFTRKQVDEIAAPWLNLCKEQEERIEELEKELNEERIKSHDYKQSMEHWHDQYESVRPLRKLAQAVVNTNSLEDMVALREYLEVMK